MIYQYHDLTGPLELDADVCVIGSGAGGAAMASELSEGGASVVVLEEGGYHPTSEFGMIPAQMIPHLYRDGGSLVAVGRPNIILTEGKCVGGTTVINGGMCWRTPEKILKRWTWEYGIPDLEPAQMDPLFAKVEERIHVAPQDPESIGIDSQLMKKGADALGYRINPNRRNQIHCPGSNNCPFGCPTGAKQSTLVSYIPRALAARTRLYADCRAERILIDGGRAKGVDAVARDPRGDGPPRSVHVRCRTVVVAGGAVQTPLLLLRNGIKRRGRDWTGRNLLLHPNIKIVGVFDQIIDGWKGVSQAYQITEFRDEGILMAETTLPPSIIAFSLPFFGKAAAEFMKQYRHMIVAGALIEDTSAGRLRLLAGRWPLMTYCITSADFERIKRGAALLAEVLFAAGARELVLPFHGLRRIQAPDGIRQIYTSPLRRGDVDLFTVHVMGTCRMGTEPRTSVTGPYGEHHLVRNLFISDASLFPTPIGVNPQVTIMALASRSAQYMLDHRQRYIG